MPRTKKQLALLRAGNRAKIAAVALGLFSRKGFHNTAVSEIAATAGISKGFLYTYYKSKDHLLESLLKEGFDRIVASLKPADEITDPYLQLEFLLRTNISMMKKDIPFWKLFLILSLQLEKKSRCFVLLNQFWSSLFDNAARIFRNMGYQNYKEEALQYGALVDGMVLHYIMLNAGVYPLDTNINMLLKKYKSII